MIILGLTPCEPVILCVFGLLTVPHARTLRQDLTSPGFGYSSELGWNFECLIDFPIYHPPTAKLKRNLSPNESLRLSILDIIHYSKVIKPRKVLSEAFESIAVYSRLLVLSFIPTFASRVPSTLLFSLEIFSGPLPAIICLAI